MHVTLLVATLIYVHNGFTTIYQSCIYNYFNAIFIILRSFANCMRLYFLNLANVFWEKFLKIKCTPF